MTNIKRVGLKYLTLTLIKLSLKTLHIQIVMKRKERDIIMIFKEIKDYHLEFD